MDSNFDICLNFTLKEEGPFSDDPRDPGGATYQGITLKEFRLFQGDPNLTITDLLAMTPAIRDEIYLDNYWTVIRADSLPSGVDCSVFDMAVNAGTYESAVLLQRAVGVSQDGIIGPITLAGIVRINDTPGLIRKLLHVQDTFYRNLSNFPIFGHGWLARCQRREQLALSMLPQIHPMAKAY